MLRSSSTARRCTSLGFRLTFVVQPWTLFTQLGFPVADEAGARLSSHHKRSRRRPAVVHIIIDRGRLLSAGFETHTSAVRTTTEQRKTRLTRVIIPPRTTVCGITYQPPRSLHNRCASWRAPRLIIGDEQQRHGNWVVVPPHCSVQCNDLFCQRSSRPPPREQLQWNDAWGSSSMMTGGRRSRLMGRGGGFVAGKPHRPVVGGLSWVQQLRKDWHWKQDAAIGGEAQVSY